MKDKDMDFSTNRDLVIDTLMQEYQNTHQRVSSLIRNFESNHLKVLILIGVLFYYAVDNFSKQDFDSYVVSVILIFVIPLFTIASIMLTVMHGTQMMMYTDYLSKVENKVNKVLEVEANYFKFDKGLVLFWEDWRQNNGHAKEGHRFSDMGFSVMLLIIYLIASLASISVRLVYLFVNQKNESILFLFITIGVVVSFAIIAVFLILYYKRIAKETDNYIF